MVENAALIVSVSSVLINIAVLLVGGTWKLSRMEIGLKDAISKARAEIDDRVDRSLREFGETAAAIRQKINEVELWARDNFVRRDGFYLVRDELKTEIKGLREDMKGGFERMEEKIDRRSS